MSLSSFFERHHKTAFYLGWILLNLLQSASTGLLDDEAYYWVYSRFLDWGYYDHPPMIAVLIKWGYALFQNELGVRLFVVAMSTGTLAMIDHLLEKRDDKLFYSIAASLFLLQIGSIIAVPDLPLMFFIALYFVVLKQWLQQPSLLRTLLLGAVIAGMLYSKYHGILIVFFTLAALPRLLLRWQTWLAAVLAALLFLPHILWQFFHGLPSVSYHLFERNATQYQFEFTLQYIIGQVLLAGPLIGWLILFSAFRAKPRNDFDKVLYWTTWGIFGLFLLATLKGRSEANWTVPAFVGLLVLAHQYLTQSPLKKWVYRLLIPSLVIVLTTRIYMMLDMKPLPWLKKDEFHKTAEWAKAIHDSAKGLPVVFSNSYQRASQYWFYTGDTAFSLNSIHYRRSNYNFWPLEERLQGKRAFLVYTDKFGIYNDSLPNPRKLMYSLTVDSFYSHSQVALEEIRPAIYKKGKVSGLLQESLVPFHRRIYLTLYVRDNDVAYTLPAMVTPSSSSINVEVNAVGLKPGTYRYKWAVETCIPGWPSLNSTSKEIEVK